MCVCVNVWQHHAAQFSHGTYVIGWISDFIVWCKIWFIIIFGVHFAISNRPKIDSQIVSPSTSTNNVNHNLCLFAWCGSVIVFISTNWIGFLLIYLSVQRCVDFIFIWLELEIDKTKLYFTFDGSQPAHSLPVAVTHESNTKMKICIFIVINCDCSENWMKKKPSFSNIRALHPRLGFRGTSPINYNNFRLSA